MSFSLLSSLAGLDLSMAFLSMWKAVPACGFMALLFPVSLTPHSRLPGQGTHLRNSMKTGLSSAFPCGSAGERLHLQCRRPGFNPWVGKTPWRRERLPTPVFWPGEFHGLCSLWGRKGSDTTERCSLSLSLPSIL